MLGIIESAGAERVAAHFDVLLFTAFTLTLIIVQEEMGFVSICVAQTATALHLPQLNKLKKPTMVWCLVLVCSGGDTSLQEALSTAA